MCPHELFGPDPSITDRPPRAALRLDPVSLHLTTPSLPRTPAENTTVELSSVAMCTTTEHRRQPPLATNEHCNTVPEVWSAKRYLCSIACCKFFHQHPQRHVAPCSQGRSYVRRGGVPMHPRQKTKLSANFLKSPQVHPLNVVPCTPHGATSKCESLTPQENQYKPLMGLVPINLTMSGARVPSPACLTYLGLGREL